MNGISLLVTWAALTAPGVEYSWRTTADNQQEYTIQIPPEFLPLVLGGQEIQSDVPADAGQVQRLCVRIGAAVQHAAAADQRFRQLLVSAGRYASANPSLAATDAQPTILWPARTNPEQWFGARTGWQPDASGNQFYVQIDRTLLRTLASGDEIYVPVDPAAGRPARFIVRSGTDKDELPRIAVPPQVPQAVAQSPPRAVNRSRFFGESDPGAAPAGNLPSVGEAPRVDPRGSAFSPVGSASFPPQVGALLDPPHNTYADAGLGRTTAGNYPPAETQVAENRFYGASPAAGPQPQVQQPARSNAAYVDDRMAAATTRPPATFTTPPAVAAAMTPPTGAPQTQDKPWGPLLFVTFALFFSIGGNLYLAYTALEYHNRYRNAIERLRSAARSS
jgi:hypothetical protein